MTYTEFCAEYERLFCLMMGYTLNEVGYQVYAEKMADLADTYPDHMNTYDEGH